MTARPTPRRLHFPTALDESYGEESTNHQGDQTMVKSDTGSTEKPSPTAEEDEAGMTVDFF